MRRAIVLGDAELEGAQGAAPHQTALDLDLSYAEARRRVLETFEEQYVEKVLADTGGNVTAAASHAGLSRAHFYRILGRIKGRGGT